MKYLTNKRRQLTGLGMGKDTKQMVSFLRAKGFNFKAFSTFMRDICRYLHDNGKVNKCPFLKLDFTGVNTPQCLCSSCYGLRRVLYKESSDHLSNKLYWIFLEEAAQKLTGHIKYDTVEAIAMSRGTEAGIHRLISCIDEFVHEHQFDEDILRDCHRDCMERSYLL